MNDLFEKPIENLDETDLGILKTRQIPEGLFIDYKLDFPKNLAKIVASFANTYGGWIVLGADADKPDNVPTNFPGIELTGANRHPKERFRDICLNINPVPLFSTKLILKDGEKRGILVAYIEESPSPPHITLDGRIYRRNAEGSDPVSETDRHTIDLLYQKANASTTQLEKELSTANLTRSPIGHTTVGYTILVHPEPVRILIPDLFARHECARCKGAFLLQLLQTTFSPLHVGQDWVAHGQKTPTRINKKGCISLSVILRDSTLEQPARIPPINEKNELQQKLKRLLELADRIYKELNYAGNCRIVLYLNGMYDVGLTEEGISTDYKCKVSEVIVPLQPLSVRVEHLGTNISEYVNLIMTEVYHSFGHPVVENS